MDGHTTCGCGCDQPTPLAKRTDTKRGHVAGQPLPFLRGHYVRKLADPLERFWALVDTTGDCWTWRNRVKGEYGIFWDGERQVAAHRYSYEQNVGPIGEGLVVCHQCDDKRCVRPDHLFLGTQQDNIDDCHAKGRGCVGERHGGAKLTATDVRLLRALAVEGAPTRSLSAVFGVSRVQVNKIITRRAWAEV